MATRDRQKCRYFPTDPNRKSLQRFPPTTQYSSPRCSRSPCSWYFHRRFARFDFETCIFRRTGISQDMRMSSRISQRLRDPPLCCSYFLSCGQDMAGSMPILSYPILQLGITLISNFLVLIAHHDIVTPHNTL
jgi:hypothetical protein